MEEIGGGKGGGGREEEGRRKRKIEAIADVGGESGCTICRKDRISDGVGSVRVYDMYVWYSMCLLNHGIKEGYQILHT